MKYLSLFTGIGGFELGIKQAYESIHNLRPNELEGSNRPEELHDTKNELQQWECVGYSEIDKYAIQVYEQHFNHKNYGDITKINADELPDFDLLVGGFPCQAFSIAGKRKGFEDTRGTLFFDIARILKAKQPRYFVLENVKGLLSHDSGQTFRTIIATLTELGYDLEWQVLNSKNFGVPQNRERVFIIGHLRGTSCRQVFPVRTSNQKNIIQLNQPTHSNDRIYKKTGLSPTLNTAQGGRRQPKVLDDYNRRIKTDDIVGTVRQTFNNEKEGNGCKIIDGVKIRRLTPKECERLQGFKDDWTSSVSDTQRYKCCGNAVTVNVIEYIFSNLLDV